MRVYPGERAILTTIVRVRRSIGPAGEQRDFARDRRRSRIISVMIGIYAAR